MNAAPLPLALNPRTRVFWVMLGLIGLVSASFYSLDLEWGQFLSMDALSKMADFSAELLHPMLTEAFQRKLLHATLETGAISILGTALAALGGLIIALAAARTPGNDKPALRLLARLLLNGLRSIPELVWAALLLIAAGLGPMAGTLALACHTTGVLGRLFAECIENSSDGPAFALRVRGVWRIGILFYATLPQIMPQLISYTLYRWENNIRAATVLGVVGAGGLGEMLTYHLSLFHMPQTSSILIAMIVLVAMVDAMSALARKREST